ncbi:MAG: sigma-70 family RNA polymerase sigma factor [Gemmatimonadaceae bacterium]|nr:sigma-70 family RNA polymerase sigma factor [Gemmatimonadaceae bacterium]
MTPSPEARFLELLPEIDRISSALSRRRGLLGVDADDFVAHVRARFVETGYAPIARFRGDSSLSTYLAVVVSSILKDYVIARDGRWRPSATALRLGPVAVQLERLLGKGNRSIREAIEEIRSGGGYSYSERELHQIVSALPRRQPLRPTSVAADEAAEAESPSSVAADAAVATGETEHQRAAAQESLQEALSALPPEDRLLVVMRFLDGQTVADIARVLRVEQKPLYRRLERALMQLRTRLERQGVTRVTVRELVAEADR